MDRNKNNIYFYNNRLSFLVPQGLSRFKLASSSSRTPTTINQNFYRETMSGSSSDGGIGSTLAGGIQIIVVILPLLSTDQCPDQVCSALTRGSSPMSIFGSHGLRVVKAGFNTFVACFSLKEQSYYGGC